MTDEKQIDNGDRKGPVGTVAAAAAALAAGLLVSHEGLKLKPYKDVVGVTTVCVGETNPLIVKQKSFTRAQCMKIMDNSLNSTLVDLAQCVHKPVTKYQAAALASWAYNVGSYKACHSGLVRKLNSGTTSAVWCRDLLRWIYAGNHVYPGLVRRRQDEYHMCIR